MNASQPNKEKIKMRTVTDTDVRGLAKQIGLNIDDKDLGAFTTLANELLQGLDHIDQLEQSHPSSASIRDVSTQAPTSSGDPFNALVLTTEIKGSPLLV